VPDHLLDGHGQQQAAGPPINLYGYPEGTVSWETPEDDMPPGYRRATLAEDIARLLRLHAEGQPGYRDAFAVVSAIRRCVERRGGRWPEVERG
jgi:hypothetical protein